jgi:hypothetical protein
VLPAVLAVGAIAAVVLLLIGIFGRPPRPAGDSLPAGSTFTTTLPTASGPPTTTPPTTSAPSTTPVTIPETTVIVLNSTDTPGLASRVSAYLGGLGWHVTDPDNFFPVLDVTTVYFPEGQEAAARMLAAAVPGDSDTVSPATPQVPSDALTVVLGNDAADWVAPSTTPTTP